MEPRKFTEKECTQSKRSIPHRKLVPECTNVTKHNCVLTNWETDEYGNQVWAGNEACDPISWQESEWASGLMRAQDRMDEYVVS